MRITRIYLGGDNANNGARFPLASVAKSVGDMFPGATLIPAVGLYRGTVEQTWVIELWDASLDEVTTLSAVLKAAFHQESLGLYVEGDGVSLV